MGTANSVVMPPFLARVPVGSLRNRPAAAPWSKLASPVTFHVLALVTAAPMERAPSSATVTVLLLTNRLVSVLKLLVLIVSTPATFVPLAASTVVMPAPLSSPLVHVLEPHRLRAPGPCNVPPASLMPLMNDDVWLVLPSVKTPALKATGFCASTLWTDTLAVTATCVPAAEDGMQT